jgi:hypothetical protein
MTTIREAMDILSYKFLMQEGIAGVSHRGSKLIVYVESEEYAEKIPYKLLGFPVEVVVSGRIYKLEALPIQEIPVKVSLGRTLEGILEDKTKKWRPAPGGVSCGHYQITAGTLSTRVYDAATGKRLFLSNNHVIANSNQGKPGDPILQPGPYDGGTDPADRIGVLERFVEIKPEPEKNLVDAAVGKPLKDEDLSDEVLDIGVVTDWEEPAVGMEVAKSGRTTCYATAKITDVNATVRVYRYPWGSSIFEDQIITTALGAPGDSGSLCVNTATKKAVGLLFAGSQTITVLNKMKHVTRLLNISFKPVAAPPPTDFLPYLLLGLIPVGMVGAVVAGREAAKAGW